MQRLIEGASALGLGLTAAQQADFSLYYENLVAWNQKFNLTAITEYEQVQRVRDVRTFGRLLAASTTQRTSAGS